MDHPLQDEVFIKKHREVLFYLPQWHHALSIKTFYLKESNFL